MSGPFDLSLVLLDVQVTQLQEEVSSLLDERDKVQTYGRSDAVMNCLQIYRCRAPLELWVDGCTYAWRHICAQACACDVRAYALALPTAAP